MILHSDSKLEDSVNFYSVLYIFDNSKLCHFRALQRLILWDFVKLFNKVEYLRKFVRVIFWIKRYPI